MPLTDYMIHLARLERRERCLRGLVYMAQRALRAVAILAVAAIVYGSARVTIYFIAHPEVPVSEYSNNVYQILCPKN